MTFTDAAAEVLRLVGRPLHYKEITDIAIEKNLLSHVGKSPEVTMGARLAATLKKDSAENPLVRVKPGVFALREWDDKTIKGGLEPKKGARKGHRSEAGAAPTAAAPTALARAGEDDEDDVLIGGDDVEEAPAEEDAAEEAAAAVEAHPARETRKPAEAAEPPAPSRSQPRHAPHPVDHDSQLSMLHAGSTAESAPHAAAGPAPEPVAAAAPAAAASAPARAEAPRAPRHRHEAHAPVSRPEMEGEGSEEVEPSAPDDVMRAEAAAGAAEMFDEEEDDDQPILGGPDDRAAPATGEAGDRGGRRRRRRRRGRTNGEAQVATGGLPSYVATPAFEGQGQGRRDDHAGYDGAPRPQTAGFDGGSRPQAPGFDGGSRPQAPGFDGGSRPQAPGFDARAQNQNPGSRPRPVAEERRDDRRDAPPRDQGGDAVYRPQLIELTAGEGHALDDLAGRELSDAVAVILATFDRNAGAVSLRQIAETAQRRGRLAGDPQLVQSQVAAAVRADNARRVTGGQRPRFRLAGGRVALTDWLLSGDLARLEQEALAAVDRYREAARRAFARKLGELPGHAFVEICVLALEKIGVSQIRALRRAGVPGGESHFSGVLRAAPQSVDELRLALVLRRDGREVGRERVADLRGSLHHYGPATAGWIFTAGQMLSGAREEAAVPGTPPVALFDGLAVARLCEDNDVAVIRARLPIAIPDVDLLEALRAS